MNIAIFGSFGERMLAPGWTKESAAAVFGGGDFDLVDSPPVDGARLTAIALFGGIDIVVAEGTQVTMSGFSFLGGRSVTIAPGDGPRLQVNAFAIFGSVDVKTPDPTD